MKYVKSIFATLTMVLALNVAANAQTDDNETVAFAGENSVEESLGVENVAKIEAIKVWPKVSAFKIMVDVENSEDVEIYNVSGRMVLNKKVEKGEPIDIETLIPGEYIVKAAGKQGAFTKK